MAWQLKLDRRRDPASKFEGQIGVFVHLYYENLADELASGLKVIPFDYKVYVSTNTKHKRDIIEAAFRRHGIDPVIKLVQNRGWDIAPFLLSFADEIRQHEICLKLHGKGSVHGNRGALWRRFLISGLLGERDNVRQIVDRFAAHDDLGILMLPHWADVARRAHIIGVNYMHMRALLARVGLKITANRRIEFPSGSMFWFRSAALAPLLDLGLSWADFADCKPRNTNATIAHAVERSILIFAASAGYKWAVRPHSGQWRNWRAPARTKTVDNPSMPH